MLKKSQVLKEGYRKGLEAAIEAIESRLLGEAFMDSYSGAMMEPEYFEGRRRGTQTNAGELVQKDWATFMSYLEKALKKAVAGGTYDWLLEDYEGQVGTRGDIVEANLMAMRGIVSWIDEMNGFYAGVYREILDSPEGFGEEDPGDWDLLKNLARRIDVPQPYGERAEYEIYPLLDILDNRHIFDSAPQSPGLETLKNMVHHLKHDNYCIDEGVTALDIPGDWYKAGLE